MWAHVVYRCDNEKANVPATFIKYNSETGLVVNNIYQVFWSPDSTDSPASVEALEGKVLELDSMPEPKRKGKQKGIGNLPLKGYYKATLLRLANTEEDLEKIIEKERIRVPTQGVEVNSSHKKSCNNQKEKKKHKMDAAKRNLQETLSICNNSQDEEREKDFYAMKQKLQKLEKDHEECAEWKKKYYATKAKNQTLKEKVDLLSSLNLTLQRQFLFKDTIKNHTESMITDEPAPSTTQVSPIVSNYKTICDMPNISSEVVVYSSLPAYNMEPLSNADPEILQPTCDKEVILDENKLILARRSVKRGEFGDSMYVKNLASALWGSELANRSVTGQKCNAKKESIARPCLTPAKRNWIESNNFS